MKTWRMVALAAVAVACSKVSRLPAGELFWRIETFASRSEAGRSEVFYVLAGEQSVRTEKGVTRDDAVVQRRATLP